MKYWKAIMAATLLLGLSSCGGGDDSDKNDPPPPTPGDPGSVVFTAKAPVFVSVDAPEGAAAKTLEKLAVDFTLKDSKGNPVDVGTTEISFSVTKLIPGRTDSGVNAPSIWKAFIYSAKSGTTDYKATFEKSTAGTLENLGSGNYRYLFAIDFKNVKDPYPSDSANNGGLIAWDEDKLHRLTVTFGQKDTAMAPVNYTLDWVPSGSTTVLTRDILEQESCSNCHMDQPIHHTDPTKGPINRADPKVCVACHNDSNPNSSRRPLDVLVHDFHSSGLTTNGGHYPQDSRNCDTCHKPETPTTQDADNWMVPYEKPCAACHSDVDFTDHKGYDPVTKPCSSCHAEGEGATKSPSVAHMGRMANEVMGRDKIVITFDNVSYVAPNIEVEMSVMVDGTPAESIDDLLKYVKWGFNALGKPASAPYILVNVDKGEGFELSYSGIGTKETNVIHFPECIAQGGGKFLCSKAVEGEVSGNLAATVAEMQICVARKNDKNGAFAAGDLLPCDSTASALSYIAIQPTKHYAHVTGGEDSDYLLKIGADMAACDGCHKDLSFHTEGGNGMEHAAKDFAQCTSCHNAVKTAYYPGEAGDLKNIVHRYHAMGSGHGGGSTFPGKVNNCESCHDKAQYNLPNQENTRPSKVQAFDATGKLLGNKYFSPTLVACASCHLKSPLGKVNVSAPAAGDEWASHMQENGAVFGAGTADEATGREECASCHAIGQDQGVDKVHKVFDFR